MQKEGFLPGQPIRSLQKMLHTICYADSCIPLVIPDGIYGAETMQAVMQFQKEHHLPETGITDRATWDAVVDAYESARIEMQPAQPMDIEIAPGVHYCKGDQCPTLLLTQVMLCQLSRQYGSICTPPATGVLDEITEDALYTFQGLCGLPQSGQLDKATWKHLALQYTLSAHEKKKQGAK